MIRGIVCLSSLCDKLFVVVISFKSWKGCKFLSRVGESGSLLSRVIQ